MKMGIKSNRLCSAGAALLILLTFLLSAFAGGSVYAETTSENQPIQISSAEELLQFAADAAKDLPLVRHLERQISLLSSAQISTLDAFFQSLVRQYFYLLDLDPKTRIMADENDALILADDAKIDASQLIFDEQGLDEALNCTGSEEFTEPVLEEKQETVADSAVREQKIPANLGGELKQQEYQIILDALIEYRGNRQQVADKLGISPRTLRYKIAKMRDEGMIIPG